MSSSSSDGVGIESPLPSDVLLGRGAGVYNHHGNVVFRLVVERNKALYATCAPLHKNAFALAIVEAVWRREPIPGRFLARSGEDGMWHEVPAKAALRKAQQCLREPNRNAKGQQGPLHGKIHLAESDRLLGDMARRFRTLTAKHPAGGGDADAPRRQEPREPRRVSEFGGEESFPCAFGRREMPSSSSSAPPPPPAPSLSSSSSRRKDPATQPAQPPIEGRESDYEPAPYAAVDAGQQHRRPELRSSGVGWAFPSQGGAPPLSSGIPSDPEKDLDKASGPCKLETTASDAVAMVDLLSRISTVSFAVARRESVATTPTLPGGAGAGIDEPPLDAAEGDFSAFEEAPPAAVGPPEEGGCGGGDLLLDDFEEGPLEASVRTWTNSPFA